MSTSVLRLPDAETEASRVKAVTGRLLGRPIVRVQRLGQGRNSRVYQLVDGAGGRYAVKQYFRQAADPRDRLDTEFTTLQWLWARGVRSVPQPIVADPAAQYGVYEYIQGEPIASSQVTEADIEEAVAFLRSLQSLRDEAKDRSVGPASEACFSLRDIVQNIEQRLQRFAALPKTAAVSIFLDEQFRPALEHVASLAQADAASALLPDEERVLSPSDFGFHNALRRNGQMVFLDFEYFGWDHPAKMIADVLLHPGMALSLEHKQHFLSRILAAFKAPGRVADQVELVYPLFGLKWCLILLNEFVPHDLQRRAFASGQTLTDELARRQFTKAETMLQQVMRDSVSFPYHVTHRGGR